MSEPFDSINLGLGFAVSGSAPAGNFLVQEDGTSTFLLEDGSGSILLEA